MVCRTIFNLVKQLKKLTKWKCDSWTQRLNLRIHMGANVTKAGYINTSDDGYTVRLSEIGEKLRKTDWLFHILRCILCGDCITANPLLALNSTHFWCVFSKIGIHRSCMKESVLRFKAHIRYKQFCGVICMRYVCVAIHSINWWSQGVCCEYWLFQRFGMR